MSHDAPTIDRNLAGTISGTHERALEKLFQHPLTHNLTLRDVTHLFETIGSAEQRSNGDVMLRLRGEHLALRPTRGKDLDAATVMDVRHLLVRAGWSSTMPIPTEKLETSVPDLLIVIDHAGARLYSFDTESQTMAAEETHHLRHQHIDREQHDADRNEDYPADRRFFETVAADLPEEGRIVLVSQGKGQSNEAEHFITYLSKHRPDVDPRIAANLIADLRHKTVPQIVHMARDALRASPISQAD